MSEIYFLSTISFFIWPILYLYILSIFSYNRQTHKMILTTDKQNQPHTPEQFRTMVATLSKNGSHRIGQSSDILNTISLIANSVVQQKQSLIKSLPLVNELFLLAAKVLTGMQGLTSDGLLAVDTTLIAIAKACCLFFRKQNSIPAAEVICIITDTKKNLFHEDSNKQEFVVTVTNPAGTSKNHGLDAIKQVPQELPSLCQSDLMMSETIAQNNYLVIKRDNIRQGYLRIAQVVLKELKGMELQFKGKSPEIINKFLEIIVCVMKVTTTQYLINLFKDIRESVWQYYTQSDQNVIRNITKENAENLWITTEQIFQRLDIEEEKNRWLQKFVAQMTLPLIRSQLLKKKSIGTKFLSQLCNQVFSAKTKYLRDSEHKNWLIKNKVFQQLFTLDTHDQIMEAGGEILKFLVKTNSLQKQQLYTLMSILQKGDVNLRRILSKIMYDLTLRYDYYQTEIILVEMKKISPTVYNQEMIKIIAQISRYSVQKHKLLGIDIFEKLISENYNSFKASIQEELFSKYIDLVKSVLEKEVGANVKAYTYFDKIISKPLQTHMILLLKKLLELFPEGKDETKYYQLQKTTFDMVKYLIEDLLLHQKLLEIINAHGDNKKKEACLDFLVMIFKIYKENVIQDKFLPLNLLQKLTNYSKVFCQLLYSYRNQNFEELFTILISQPVPNLEHLTCLKQLFYYINRSNMMKVVSDSSDNSFQVNVIPDTLNGFKDFMNVILEVEQKGIREDAASFICQMYCHLSPDLTDQKGKIITQFVQQLIKSVKISYQDKNDSRLLGYMCLIEGMMNQTQTRGVGKLIAHSSLVNIESIKITITNEITYGYDITRNHESKFPSNWTLFQMLVDVGKVFKCSPRDIILKMGEQQIKPIYNGLTIHELGLKDKVLSAYKRNRQSIPKAQLVDVYNRLTEPAIAVFTSTYLRFAPNGQMVPVDAAKFVQSSTNDSCTVQDYRVVDLFTKYDSNKDGILDLQGFLSFFEDSCKSRESTVWRNLEALRIRPDLKRYEDVKEELDYSIMARYIIYESNIYDILFELTQNSKLKQKAIKLLKRLPTSQRIIKETLENIKFEDKDEFVSWYKLTLIQWMIHENVDQKEEGKELKQTKQNEKKFNTHTAQKTNKKGTQKDEDEYWISNGQTLQLSQSEKPQKDTRPEDLVIKDQPQPDIAHIETATINEWKERFLKNKMYIKILEQAESISETPLNSMSATNKNCLLLCLQIVRRLCKVPELQKPLLSSLQNAPQIKLIDMPNNKLSQKLIPQLFEGDMNSHLLEPLLCLLFEIKNLELKLIHPGLFHSEKDVRVITTNFLYLHQRLHSYNIKVLEIEPKDQCEEFFDIINKIVIEDDKINLQEVFNKTYNEIKSHNIKEEIGSKKSDYLFQGKLSVLNTILVVLPEMHLNTEIQQILIQKLHQALFPTTRQTLYNLLLKTEVSGLFKYLADFIRLVEPKKPATIKNYFVGLYNLGCICYMNSILQQFYMTPQFRYALLAIQNQGQISISEKKGKQFKDNILYQLQKMFAYLELSQRGQYSPEQFCYSYKSDINVGIQEDSQQFLGMTFSRIEAELKNTIFSDLVDKIYGGKTIVTIRCSKCEKEKYRVEDFNNLQLEVKERKNIDESLSRYTQMETINDYLCEFCKAEGIIRSTNLYHVPNVLIVHLMRMVFDVETYERIKLHNKLEFPLDLNLRKFMKAPEGQQLPQQEECQYALKGVVIHSGCAESGHYYSLIKNNNDWFKFDDSRVTHFSVNDLSDEAFGGREEYNDWGVSGSTRSKNAYMLIYEKKIKTPWIIKKQTTEQQKELIKRIADTQDMNEDEEIAMQRIKLLKFNGYIRRDLYEDVIKDHKVLFHQLQFYHEGFFKFLKSVIQKTFIRKEYFDEIVHPGSRAYTQHQELMSSQEKDLYKNLLQFLFKLMEFFTKASNPDINLIKTIIPYIDLCLFILPEQAEELFLKIDNGKCMDIILSHSDSIIRDAHRSILNRCVNIIIQRREVRLNDQTDDSFYKLKIIQLLENISGLLYTEVPKNPSKLSQYFEFWKVFSFSSKECMRYCFNKNFISIFLDFLLQKKSPIMLNPGTYSLSKYTCPSIEPLLTMLSGLVINAKTRESNEDDDFNYVLTENDRKCLTFVPFYKLMIQQKQDFSGLIKILSKLVQNNFHFSLEIAAFLMNGINKSERYESALAYMMIIDGYLAVNDEYQRQRLEWVLGVPQLIQSAPKEYSIKSSIRSQNVRYLSSLFAGKPDSYKSVLQLLYSQRRNPDSFSVTGVSILLNLLTKSKDILQYVVALPPPCYCYAKYTDWIPLFVDSFQKDRFIILPQDKEKVAEKCFSSLISIDKQTQKLITEQKDRQMAEQLMREEEEQQEKRWREEVYEEEKLQQKEAGQQKQVEQVQQQTQHEAEQKLQKEEEKIKLDVSHQEQMQHQIQQDQSSTRQNYTETIELQKNLEATYCYPQIKKQQQHHQYFPRKQEEQISNHFKPNTVLTSLYPLTIIGTTNKIQSKGSYTVQQQPKFVKFVAEVLYTYTLESRPTGDDNISLSKQLFEQQSNYKSKPLRYFVEGETQLLSEIDEIEIPIVQPTIIHIKIETNTSIIVTSKNPRFNYNFYYTDGSHLLNIPYLNKEIDELIQIKFESFEVSNEAERKDEGVQSVGIQQFQGPLPRQDYMNMHSAWQQNEYGGEVMCPTCTFINTRGMSQCEVCQSSLST